MALETFEHVWGRVESPGPSQEGPRRAHEGPGGVECSAADREVAVERDDAEFKAANERITTMAEDLRKAEQVRDRLEELDRLMGSYPEGHAMRTRLVELHIERALEGVEEDIRVLMDDLQHPRGT
jgi:hypothetical protein